MKVCDIIKEEVQDYLTGTVYINGVVPYSEYKLKKRITYFKNAHYPTGKVNEDGDYEHWFDIIQPMVNNEIKNLDFDTKHILTFSKTPIQDFAAMYVANLLTSEHMRENGSAEQLNEGVEDFSGDGNLLFRKTSEGYEACDMMNSFVTNPLARTIDDTDFVERFTMTESALRKMDGVYTHVDDVIKYCGDTHFEASLSLDGQSQKKTKKEYELFRRTGEITEKAFREAQGREGGSDSKLVMVRVIVAGLDKNESGKERVLFAEELKGKMSDYFKESHRGIYKGRWWREGLYELLMDHQVSYNDISNAIDRGLRDWASKVIFTGNDRIALDNLRTQLKNGSYIQGENMRQLEVRVQGFDQLMAERNEILRQAADIANSHEIVQGKNLPAGTAYRTAAQMNVNANKLFVILRQKLTITYRSVFREFVLPNLIKDASGRDVIRVTGDPEFLRKFHEMAAVSWYRNNLAAIGPHTPETRDQLIALKVEELMQTDPLIENSKEIWKGIMPRLDVTITGENYLVEQFQDIMEFLMLEQDPNRRAYLLDLVYASKGIPVPPPVQQAVSDGAQAPSQGDEALPVPEAPREPVAA